MVKDKPKCNRSGLCCIIPFTGKDCKYLIRLKSGKTLCRIYKNRLGKVIDKRLVDGKMIFTKCVLRSVVKQNYGVCEFNREEYDEPNKKD